MWVQSAMLKIKIIILNTIIKQTYNNIIICSWQKYRNMMKTKYPTVILK